MNHANIGNNSPNDPQGDSPRDPRQDSQERPTSDRDGAPEPGECELRYLLSAYLFDNISEAGRREVETELERNPHCRAELDDLRETLELIEDALGDGDVLTVRGEKLHGDATSPRYSFEERRLERVLEASLRRGPRGGRKLTIFGGLSAAALVLLSVVGIGFFRAGLDMAEDTDAAPPQALGDALAKLDEKVSKDFLPTGEKRGSSGSSELLAGGTKVERFGKALADPSTPPATNSPITEIALSYDAGELLAKEGDGDKTIVAVEDLVATNAGLPLDGEDSGGRPGSGAGGKLGNRSGPPVELGSRVDGLLDKRPKGLVTGANFEALQYQRRITPNDSTQLENRRTRLAAEDTAKSDQSRELLKRFPKKAAAGKKAANDGTLTIQNSLPGQAGVASRPAPREQLAEAGGARVSTGDDDADGETRENDNYTAAQSEIPVRDRLARLTQPKRRLKAKARISRANSRPDASESNGPFAARVDLASGEKGEEDWKKRVDRFVPTQRFALPDPAGIRRSFSSDENEPELAGALTERPAGSAEKVGKVDTELFKATLNKTRAVLQDETRNDLQKVAPTAQALGERLLGREERPMNEMRKIDSKPADSRDRSRRRQVETARWAETLGRGAANSDGAVVSQRATAEKKAVQQAQQGQQAATDQDENLFTDLIEIAEDVVVLGDVDVGRTVTTESRSGSQVLSLAPQSDLHERDDWMSASAISGKQLERDAITNFGFESSLRSSTGGFLAGDADMFYHAYKSTPTVLELSDATGVASDLWRVNEAQLRTWGYYKNIDAELSPQLIEARQLTIPAPVIGDEGLGEAGFRAKYGVTPFVSTRRDNQSTFGMDVDDAAWARSREALRGGSLPLASTVRVEEFVNHFSEERPADPSSVFTVRCEGGPSPFGDEGLELLEITVKSRELRLDERKDAILTFAVDTSGSMAADGKLQLVRDSMKRLVSSLEPTDRVAIVAFSNRAYVALPHTSARQQETIGRAIDSLTPTGGTNVGAGIDLAYRLANEARNRRAANRVILCSDGVATLGSRGPEEVLARVRRYAQENLVSLFTYGFGSGGKKAVEGDKMLQRLANEGDGNYRYVDSASAARQLFSLPEKLQLLAADAKIQVEFDPHVVTHYRLLGYEKRDIADKDFRNDARDAGEVGPGSTVTVLYELDRRSQASSLGRIFLRYRDVSTRRVEEFDYDLPTGVIAASLDSTSERFLFTASVAELAELLRDSYFARDGSYGAVLDVLDGLSQATRARADWQEARELVSRAQRLNAARTLESLTSIRKATK